MNKKIIPKRRNGYYYKNNDLTKPYVSVTKVLKVIDKPALFFWAIKKASQIALKDPELNEDEVKLQFMADLKETQKRGKYIHRLVEQMPKVYKGCVPDEYLGYYKGLRAWWDKNSPKPLAQELEVYSDKYMVAGRLDGVYEINGKKCLIDFKTGKDVYKEVGLQLAFYKHVLIEEGIIAIDKTLAVCFMETGESLEKETNDTIEDFANVLDVWRWIQKKG